MKQPFLALPYLAFLHREIVLLYRVRENAKAECDRFIQEAQTQMLALEERQRVELSRDDLQKAQTANREHLENWQLQAEKRARTCLAARLYETEAMVRHLHAEPFGIPPERLHALEQAGDDASRTVAVQAIAKFMLLFLRIPLKDVYVLVTTVPRTTNSRWIKGTYLPPGLIRIFRWPEDRPSRLLAILAHEMCHHLLHHFQIKTPAGLDEERLTDAATIYFNFTPMMIPEYEQMFALMENQLAIFKLGYLEAKELERANRFARSIQSGEKDLMSLVEPDSIRVRKDSLGCRFTLPLDVPFHGVVSLHEETRLRFRAFDLLAWTPEGAPVPEVVFITNKVVAQFGPKILGVRATRSSKKRHPSING